MSSIRIICCAFDIEKAVELVICNFNVLQRRWSRATGFHRHKRLRITVLSVHVMEALRPVLRETRPPARLLQGWSWLSESLHAVCGSLPARPSLVDHNARVVGSSPGWRVEARGLCKVVTLVLHMRYCLSPPNLRTRSLEGVAN